jgi:predicted GIY-YIG superfamily endonuclease
MVLPIGERHRRKYSVYFLRCPVTLSVRYVGITSDEVARKQCHTQKKKEQESGNPRRRKWVEWLRSKKLRPTFEVKLTGLSWHAAISVEKRLLLLHHTLRPWTLVNKSVYELAPMQNGGIGIFMRKLGKKLGSKVDIYA